MTTCEASNDCDITISNNDKRRKVPKEAFVSRLPLLECIQVGRLEKLVMERNSEEEVFLEKGNKEEICSRV
jgi:hypothetical protein